MLFVPIMTKHMSWKFEVFVSNFGKSQFVKVREKAETWMDGLFHLLLVLQEID